jgi:hypothetical protein
MADRIAPWSSRGCQGCFQAVIARSARIADNRQQSRHIRADAGAGADLQTPANRHLSGDAQPPEPLHRNQEVAGSSPASSISTPSAATSLSDIPRRRRSHRSDLFSAMPAVVLNAALPYERDPLPLRQITAGSDFNVRKAREQHLAIVCRDPPVALLRLPPAHGALPADPAEIRSPHIERISRPFGTGRFLIIHDSVDLSPSTRTWTLELEFIPNPHFTQPLQSIYLTRKVEVDHKLVLLVQSHHEAAVEQIVR